MDCFYKYTLSLSKDIRLFRIINNLVVRPFGYVKELIALLMKKKYG